MDSEVLISVIITTYRRDVSILKRAIDSVSRQTERRFEIIVVNDYPPYKQCIEELIRNYQNIVFISHEINEGACKSRNDGIARAKGKFIALLDDDDEWIDEKLEKQLNDIRVNNTVFSYCTGYYYDDEGKNKGTISLIRDCCDNPTKALAKLNCLGGCSFPLIRKSILSQSGVFDEDMPASQDFDLWIRICKQGNISYLNEPLVKYYIGSDSITSNIMRSFEGHYKIIKKHSKVFKKYKKEFTFQYWNCIFEAMAAKRLGLCIKLFIMSFYCFPYNLRIIKQLYLYVTKRELWPY